MSGECLLLQTAPVSVQVFGMVDHHVAKKVCGIRCMIELPKPIGSSNSNQSKGMSNIEQNMKAWSTEPPFIAQYNFVTIGNTSVGKSAILRRFALNEFSPIMTSTIGIDFRIKYLAIDGITDNQDDYVVKIAVWDTGKMYID